jgi:CheY-like chemotaxis protein
VSKFIVLAEDDADDQLLFTEALRQVCKESTLIIVPNGLLMLELLESKKDALPHAIIVDVNMPAMSGIECLKMIRKTPGISDVAVIIMSTSANDHTIHEAFINGADSYAVKPGKFDELKKIVEKVLTTDWAALKGQRDKKSFLMKLSPVG